MKVNEVLETCLYVDDLRVAEEFYSQVLGLEAFSRVEGRHIFFRCGRTVFLLFNPEVTRVSDPAIGVPAHGATGEGHVCFTMKEDEIEQWRGHLAREGVEVEKEIRWPSGGRSLYFRDPAGNSLELATRKTWEVLE